MTTHSGPKKESKTLLPKDEAGHEDQRPKPSPSYVITKQLDKLINGLLYPESVPYAKDNTIMGRREVSDSHIHTLQNGTQLKQKIKEGDIQGPIEIVSKDFTGTSLVVQWLIRHSL